MSTDRELKEALDDIMEDVSVDIEEMNESAAIDALSYGYDTEAVQQLLEQIHTFSSEKRDMCINKLLNLAAENKLVKRFKEHLKTFKAAYAQTQIHQNVTGYATLKTAPEGQEELIMQYRTGNYIMDNTGIYKTGVTKDGDFVKTSICCQPVIIIAVMKNVQDSSEKVVISFYQKRWHNLTVDKDLILSFSKVVQLARYGVDISSNTAKEMVSYFQCIIQKNYEIIPVISTINRLGWYNREFVPYSDTVQCDTADNFKDIYKSIKTGGDFEVWKNHCYTLLENIPFRLTMAASFAAPLIMLVGGLPFILHLWGGSGAGKTVSLHVAASIWGKSDNGFVKSLNGTAHGISETAAFLYSLPCILDELQTIKDTKSDYNRLIMHLTEGTSRTQGAAEGGIKASKRWKNCFLTTGEDDIIAHNSGAGAVNRVISIECSNDKIILDGPQTMSIIKENYGHAGIEYIKGLQSETGLSERHREIFKNLLSETDTTDKQAMAMSFLLLADELSCKYIFTDLEPLQVSDVACYMATKKEVDIYDRCLEWIFDWVSQNINKFECAALGNGEIWGRIDDDYILINKSVLADHMKNSGFSYKTIIPTLAKRGMILKDSEMKYTHSTKVYGVKARYVKFKNNLT